MITSKAMLTIKLLYIYNKLRSDKKNIFDNTFGNDVLTNVNLVSFRTLSLDKPFKKAKGKATKSSKR